MATVLTRTNSHIVLSNRREIEISTLTDGEVVALDNDGCIVQWDAHNATLYNCGETLAQFGPENLLDTERARVE